VKREYNGHQADRGAGRARWVENYRASGLSLQQFAKRHGLRFGQLHYWVYGSSKRERAPLFQEVRLCGPPAPAKVWSAEVGLPDGTTVRLVRGTEVEWIQALVECLRRPCSSL
jgi:hypothetical protein